MILEDDARNDGWKPVAEYWKKIVNLLTSEIKNTSGIEQTTWVAELNTRLAKVFDDTYRKMGGVRKFYEVKGKARLEMARHIGRHVERELFGRWKVGSASLTQLRQFTDALIATIDERQTGFAGSVAKMPATLQALHQRNADLTTQFNNISFLRQHLTDKRGALFSDIAMLHQELYILRTNLEGLKFAASLIPFIKEQLTTLRGRIDELHQTLATATEKIDKERAARLGATDAAYQKRIFDRTAIDSVLKVIVVDEASQLARTQRVRQSIINLAGTDVDSFDKLSQGIALSSIMATLSQESVKIVDLAHAEISKTLQPVLHVNIVERLQRQYDANPNGLKTFVSELYSGAGSMLVFNKTEVDRTVANNAGGSQGRTQTIGIFLPQCENQKPFRESLKRLFEEQKDPASDTKVSDGKLANEIVIMKIASLMPARFIDSLGELKRHYDGLLRDTTESYLLHSEGDGGKLPPLFARSAVELNALAKPKPFLLVARLLGMIKERQNRTSGLMEWAFIYMTNGLPASKILRGKSWEDILHGEHPSEIQDAIGREVNRRIELDFKHIDKKSELLSAYQQMALARFNDAGEDDQDPGFLALSAMDKQIRDIIGLQAAGT